MDTFKSNDLYHKIFDNAVVAIGVTDATGKYILVNRAWCNFLCYSPEEAQELTVQDITADDELETSSDNFSRLMSGELEYLQKRRRYKRKDGSTFWAELYVSGIHDQQGRINGVLGIFTNIDKEMKAEQNQRELTGYLEKLNEDLENAHNSMLIKNQELTEAYHKLSKLSRHDSLTGLYNRRTLEEIINQEVLRSVRTKRGFAMAIADIDNFKKFNDTYGHDCGDEVLKMVAGVFLDKIRQMDSVGRWGGEEFLFVFPETNCLGAEIVLQRVREAVANKPVIYEGKNLSVTVTVGFSYHRGQLKPDEIISEADKALYQGKNSGKNKVICFQGQCPAD